MSDAMINTHTHTHTYLTENTTCHITMTDLMMNVHTCFTDDTSYTMVYVRSVLSVKDVCIFIIASDIVI
jgi:hypothetical protein